MFYFAFATFNLLCSVEAKAAIIRDDALYRKESVAVGHADDQQVAPTSESFIDTEVTNKSDESEEEPLVSKTAGAINGFFMNEKTIMMCSCDCPMYNLGQHPGTANGASAGCSFCKYRDGSSLYCGDVQGSKLWSTAGSYQCCALAKFEYIGGDITKIQVIERPADKDADPVIKGPLSRLDDCRKSMIEGCFAQP